MGSIPTWGANFFQFGQDSRQAASVGSSPTLTTNFNYGVNPRKYGYIVLAKTYPEARESSIYGNARRNPCYVGSSPTHPANFNDNEMTCTQRTENVEHGPNK